MKKEKIVNAIKNGIILKKIDSENINKLIIGCSCIVSEKSGLRCEEMDLNRFIEFLIEDYYFITGEDLYLICEYGAIGEFGEYYGINQKSFLKWTKEYLKVRDVITRDLKKQESEGDNTHQLLQNFDTVIKYGLENNKFTPDGVVSIKKLYAGTKYIDKIKPENCN